MKLSEAIRLGAMLKPQGFGEYVRAGATCAMGAAFDALGALDVPFSESEVFPIVSIVSPRCPICNARSYCGDIGSMIFHLNDDHKWTRERIADQVEIWEEAIEAAQDAAIAVPVKVLAHVQG